MREGRKRGGGWGEKCWIGVGEGGGKRMRQTSFRVVSLLFPVDGWVSGRWLEKLELKPTLQLRVGQSVFLRVSDDPNLCGHMYVVVFL